MVGTMYEVFYFLSLSVSVAICSSHDGIKLMTCRDNKGILWTLVAHSLSDRISNL